MSQRQDKQYWLDDPGNVDRLVKAFYAVCMVLFLADLIYHRHALFALEAWFGFYAWFGFIACVTLVLIAKLLRKVLMRPEEYYENQEHGRAPDGDGE